MPGCSHCHYYCENIIIHFDVSKASRAALSLRRKIEKFVPADLDLRPGNRYYPRSVIGFGAEERATGNETIEIIFTLRPSFIVNAYEFLIRAARACEIRSMKTNF